MCQGKTTGGWGGVQYIGGGEGGAMGGGDTENPVTRPIAPDQTRPEPEGNQNQKGNKVAESFLNFHREREQNGTPYFIPCPGKESTVSHRALRPSRKRNGGMVGRAILGRANVVRGLLSCYPLSSLSPSIPCLSPCTMSYLVSCLPCVLSPPLRVIPFPCLSLLYLVITWETHPL